MDNQAKHFIQMLERLIKNKESYNIVELNQSVFEIAEYFNANYKLDIELSYKNVLSKKTLDYLKNTIRLIK